MILTETLKNVLTQKQQDFVLALSTEIKTQDNLATSSPYVIINTQNRVRMGPECWADDYYLSLDFETKIYNNDELIEYTLKEYPAFTEWLEDNLEELSDVPKLDIDDGLKRVISEYQDFCNDHDIDIVYYEEEQEASKNDINVFFTHKAYKEHIEANSHHYNEPKSYLKHLFRNPEMEGVLDVVHTLAHTIELESERVCVYSQYEHTSKLWITGCDNTLVLPDYVDAWDFCPACGGKISLRKEQK